MASSWILFFSYQDDARSNTHQSTAIPLLPLWAVRTEPQCLYKGALYLPLFTLLSTPLFHLTNSRVVALHYRIPDQCKLHTVNPNAFY